MRQTCTLDKVLLCATWPAATNYSPHTCHCWQPPHKHYTLCFQNLTAKDIAWQGGTCDLKHEQYLLCVSTWALASHYSGLNIVWLRTARTGCALILHGRRAWRLYDHLSMFYIHRMCLLIGGVARFGTPFARASGAGEPYNATLKRR